MAKYTIRNLPDLLTIHLEPNTEIIDTNITRLSLSGYGSILLKVDLKIKNKNGSEEPKHLVAKVLPDSEYSRQLFKIQVTYKKEVSFYSTVIPTLRHFQMENGIKDTLNMFANFYGARINLDNTNDTVTDDAVLLMENLVELGK